MGSPRRIDVDAERALLYAADVLANRLDRPRYVKPVREKFDGNDGAEDDAQMGNELAEFIQHRNDLSGMAETVR